MKIVSLVPSYTKLLVDIGLRDSIVGITRFCVEPSDLHRSAVLVGGTKDPNIELIRKLEADVVLVNSEENRLDDIKAIRAFSEVFESCPKTVDQGLDLIESFYQYFNLKKNANLALYREKLKKIRSRNEQSKAILYFIWKEPFMVASKSTYIGSVLELAGYDNLSTDKLDYPVITVDEIKGMPLDYIILSTEPYPFRKRDCRLIEEKLAKQYDFMKACGKIFSWHGSYTRQAIDLIFDRKDILEKIS